MRGSGVPEEVDPDTSAAIMQALHVMRESPPQPNASRSSGASVAASASDSESVRTEDRLILGHLIGGLWL